jgi:phosphoribosyl 1,2-cyclic phosphate phosphodiesterase
MKLVFMGTGGSLGVPVVGCHCPVCTSEDQKNTRTRPSLLIQNQETNILLDTSYDFRLQALANGIEHLDAIIYTHAHADHVLGIDDVRIIAERMRKQVPVFGSADTIQRLQKMFGYVFKTNIWGTSTPRLRPKIINGPFSVGSIDFTPVPVIHENIEVLGFRFDDIAYVTDVSYIPPASMRLLRSLDLLIISALRYKPHPKHLSIEQVLEIIETLAPERALLTHISHDVDHDEFDKSLPDNVSPAYDSMVIEL